MRRETLGGGLEKPNPKKWFALLQQRQRDHRPGEREENDESNLSVPVYAMFSG
jgi:hypothetical protein